MTYKTTPWLSVLLFALTACGEDADPQTCETAECMDGTSTSAQPTSSETEAETETEPDTDPETDTSPEDSSSSGTSGDDPEAGPCDAAAAWQASCDGDDEAEALQGCEDSIEQFAEISDVCRDDYVEALDCWTDETTCGDPECPYGMLAVVAECMFDFTLDDVHESCTAWAESYAACEDLDDDYGEPYSRLSCEIEARILSDFSNDPQGCMDAYYSTIACEATLECGVEAGCEDESDAFSAACEFE